MSAGGVFWYGANSTTACEMLPDRIHRELVSDLVETEWAAEGRAEHSGARAD